MQDEFAPGARRATQIHGERTFGLDARVHFHLVETETVAALVFGAVERQVGAAHDVVDAVGRRNGNADADVNVDLDTVDPERLCDALDQLLGELSRRGLVRAARQNGEFVAGQPGDHVGRWELRRAGGPPPVSAAGRRSHGRNCH